MARQVRTGQHLNAQPRHCEKECYYISAAERLRLAQHGGQTQTGPTLELAQKQVGTHPRTRSPRPDGARALFICAQCAQSWRRAC